MGRTQTAYVKLPLTQPNACRSIADTIVRINSTEWLREMDPGSDRATGC